MSFCYCGCAGVVLAGLDVAGGAGAGVDGAGLAGTLIADGAGTAGVGSVAGTFAVSAEGDRALSDSILNLVMSLSIFKEVLISGK